MKQTIAVMFLSLAVGAGAAWAHEGHDEATEAAEHASALQPLTGEVVDVACYLEHGKDGLGAAHAGCAKKCIQKGLPVALKIGDQLYLAVMASHEPANKTLARFAGQQVTVRGHLMEQDGQHVVFIDRVEQSR